MPSAVLTIQWDNYAGTPDAPGLFAITPLAYNSRQSRLHDLAPGDKLWLVSRASDNQQYYIVAVLTVAAHRHNTPFSGEPTATASDASLDPSNFGPYAILADPDTSHDLQRRFPAEGLLRALTFDTAKPIKHGANIGQSLQTLRFLTPADEQLLDSALDRITRGESPLLDTPFGLWPKCDPFFDDYFLKNWTARRRPQAFLLYDSPPALPPARPSSSTPTNISASPPASSKASTSPPTASPATNPSGSPNATASGTPGARTVTPLSRGTRGDCSSTSSRERGRG